MKRLPLTRITPVYLEALERVYGTAYARAMLERYGMGGWVMDTEEPA